MKTLQNNILYDVTLYFIYKSHIFIIFIFLDVDQEIDQDLSSKFGLKKI